MLLLMPNCLIQVQSFWNTYAYLKPPSTLPVVTDYQLFRSGVRPVWEDPENIKGGKWILRLRKGIVDQLWEDLVLAIIGGNIVDDTADVCGAVVSIRAAEDIISVWIRREDPDLVNSVRLVWCSANGEDTPADTSHRDEIYRSLNQSPATLEMQYKSNSGECFARSTPSPNKDTQNHCKTKLLNCIHQNNTFLFILCTLDKTYCVLTHSFFVNHHYEPPLSIHTRWINWFRRCALFLRRYMCSITNSSRRHWLLEEGQQSVSLRGPAHFSCIW